MREYLRSCLLYTSGSVLIIIVLYVLLTTVITGIIPFEKLVESTAPLADAAAGLPLIGEFAGSFIAIAGIIVVLGATSSVIMFQPRLEYAMAKDGLFFKSFGKVHPKYNTPYFSIIVQCMLAILMVFASNISDLLGYFTVVLLLKNTMAFVTIFVPVSYTHLDVYKRQRQRSVWAVSRVL